MGPREPRMEPPMPVHFPPLFFEETWTHRKQAQGRLRGALLAAGLGRRMDPLTVHHLPKPMFPLGGKVPMAEIWVRRFLESGLTDITMNLCVLSQTIRRHFRDGSRFGARICYVEEDQPTGTLGGVCKQALGHEAKAVLPGERMPDLDPFMGSTLVVPSGDIVTNFGAELLEEMYDIHKRVGAAFTMVLAPVPWERRRDFGTAVLDRPEALHGPISRSGRIVSFREKDAASPSNLNNASIYLIEMDLLKQLDPLRSPASPEAELPFYDFGKQVFPLLLGKHPRLKLPRDYLLWGIQYDGGWFDVGNKRDYIRVNESLLDGRIRIPLPYEKLPWGYLGTDVAIDFGQVTVIPPVIIGNDCVVQHGAVIGPYAVIGDGWTIGRNAHIEHAVLWQPYTFFPAHGDPIPPDERRLFDRHEVRSDVTIRESIVVGGEINRDLEEQTVDLLEDGQLNILPIDHVPDGLRA